MEQETEQKSLQRFQNLVEKGMKRCVIGIGLLLFSVAAMAQQDQEEAGKQEDEERLPPIVLPEFDITGKEQPEPPEFSKYDFFSDRVFSTPIRDPNLDERESAGLNLGRKPELSASKPPSSLTGRVVAGYGKFKTPSFGSWIGRIGRAVDANVSGIYSSSGGHVPFSEYWRARLKGSVSWKLDSKRSLFRDGRLFAAGGFEFDRYKFYGSATPSQSRSIYHGSARVDAISSFEPWDLRHNMWVSWHTYSVSDVAKTTENEISVGFEGSKAVGPVSVGANADISANFLNMPVSNEDLVFVAVGAKGEGRLFPGFQFRGGVAFYSLKNSDTDSRILFYPQVEARYFAGSLITIFAKAVPGARKNSLRKVMVRNPYLSNAVAIRHEETFADFSGGVELAASEHVRGRIIVSYQRSRSYPIRVDSDRNGKWELSYEGKVRILMLAANASVQISNKDKLLGSIRVLDSEYSITRERVPYLPSASFTATYQRRIGPRLTIQGSIQYLGQRYADLGATRKLKSYARVDVRGEYYFSRFIGLFVMTENLFDQDYAVWENYVDRPFYIQAGLTAKL